MKTIYIVTGGDFSDYRIEAIFDSKEKAESYIKKYDEFNDCRIEEWHVNYVWQEDPTRFDKFNNEN